MGQSDCDWTYAGMLEVSIVDKPLSSNQRKDRSNLRSHSSWFLSACAAMGEAC